MGARVTVLACVSENWGIGCSGQLFYYIKPDAGAYAGMSGTGSECSSGRVPCVKAGAEAGVGRCTGGRYENCRVCRHVL